MKVLCAQLDITKLNVDLNLKKTVILMQHMYGNACKEVVNLSGAIQIYTHFVKNDDVPLQWIEKWSHKFNIHTDIRTVFKHIIKTTQDPHLRWFQYRLIYRTVPSLRLLFLMKVVNSAIFTFREEDEGTLEHLFWDCAKIKVF